MDMKHIRENGLIPISLVLSNSIRPSMMIQPSIILNVLTANLGSAQLTADKFATISLIYPKD
ncbi:MAG: hypothetical protein CL862_07710 [Cyanobium sp. NAT70]|nr:hypothetical protein [Cyanobium sp. NAT70]